VEINIKNDIGEGWIMAINETLNKIDKFSVDIDDKLMDLSEYRMYNLSSKYLKEFRVESP
jgi:hypothetical protein